MTEEILTTAVKAIDALHNIQCSIEQQKRLYQDVRIDAQIRLVINREVIMLNADVKSKIVPAQIPKIVSLKEDIDSLIVIARYITPRAKEMLIKEQIPYADTAGNLFLNKKMIYILIENKKSNLDKIESKGRAFTPAGLKVLYQFLLHPEYINKPYRFIGKRADVTIRTVGKTLEGLVNEKYILKENENTYLYTDREKLLQSWVTAYNKKLRPKLSRRRFRWRGKSIGWQNINLPESTLWGGAAAGELLTNYLIANEWTVYTELDFIEIMEKFQLIPDKKGDIEVVKRFWNETSDDINNFKENIVNPILVYADLIEETNYRYVETAKIIYNEHVKNNL